MRLWFVTGEDDGKFVALCVCFSRHTQTMNREISALKGFLLVFYNKTTQRTRERGNLSNVIKHNKDYQGGRKSTIGAQFPQQTHTWNKSDQYETWHIMMWVTYADRQNISREMSLGEFWHLLNWFFRQLQFCSYHQLNISALTNRSKISY